MDYLLRFLLCLLKWTLIVVVVASLAVGAFTLAMNYSNISILVADGMKTRTGVALGFTDPAELPKFFSQQVIANDAILQDQTYADYKIRGFDARVDVEKLETLPWEETATVILRNEVPAIDGELPVAKQSPEQLKNPNKIPPPAMQGGRYELKLSKAGGQWRIVSLKEIPEAA